MDIYEKVLRKLLIESTKLNKLPDHNVIKPPYVLVDKEGFNHYLIKSIDDIFFLQDPDGNMQRYSYKELTKKFEGE